jgi:type VI protein secretion system component VasF
VSDTTEIGGDIRELRQRTTVLIWAVGIIAALVIAMLGNTITMSYQLGQTIGRLDVLIDRVSLR